MHPAYLQCLHDGITLVTPTRRLAGLVTARYGAAMRLQGLETWEAPPVMPLGAWLTETHRRLLETPGGAASAGMLLSPDQALSVWEQAVDQRGVHTSLSVEALARLAADAWTTGKFWDLPPPDPEGAGLRADVRAFRRWRERFERRCAELDAIDQISFADTITGLSPAFRDALASFRLFGFAPLPPLLRRLVAACAAGGAFGLEGDGSAIGDVDTRVFANADEEYAAAMHWAVATRRAAPDANVFVALAGRSRIDAGTRAKLLRGFDAGIRAGDAQAPVALDCPETRALADAPLVETALLLLDQRPPRAWQEISKLLLSPYLGGASAERSVRARLDREHRRNGDIETGWRAVRATAQRLGLDCPALLRVIDVLDDAAGTAGRRARLHDWMAHAERILRAAGWPGDAGLSVAEQGVLLEWGRVMDNVAALDAVMPPCTWPVALTKWRALLRQRRQSAAAPVDAVNIVTLPEAAFVQPDHLWVLGLNDHAWPAPVENNPLLPLAALREHAVPGSDPGRDLRAAELVLDAVAMRPERIVFSYAALESDTPRRPFPGLGVAVATSGPASGWAVRAREVESIEDAHATPVPSSAALGGGVAVFTDLAACPFRALARHRLHAVTPEDPTPGLNALQRGNLVHAVMAAFWEHMGSSERLAASAASAIEALLGRIATEEIARAAGRYALPQAYWDLEQRRLVTLALDWLEIERKRGEFEVLACEQAATATIGGFSLNTRIDRIDRLGDGSLLIVDYKTGEVSAKRWEPPRPEEPQLPIYAIATQTDSVAGIAYAQIRSGKHRIVDFPDKCTAPAGIDEAGRAEWATRCEAWDAALGTLARQWQSGHAPADPKRGRATCRNCDLGALCRIDEISGADPSDEVSDDE